MSDQSRLKLFPMTVQEILSVIPLSINHAELLYREGRISFQPEPAKKLQPEEQIIQLSERYAFRRLEKGCRAFR
jgi:hypothetical protein